jgi:CDP-6-deoxy-D-xylo-4-hexulose-3-dehydrase
MANIRNNIEEMIESLGDDFQLLKYVYNDNKKFTPGVTPIYYSGPYWSNEEVVAGIESLLTGKWLSSGENVKRFEDVFARKINDKYAIMVNSGSSANLVLIAAVKKYFCWDDGDEIIVSVVGFPTTISVIAQNNLKPVFIDIEMATLNFDLDLVEEKITGKTKAIFVSPVLGNPPDFDKIIAICEKYKLQLILDNCDSLGSAWRGRFLNEYAVASSDSFYPAHTITTGEGGMVTSNSKDIVKIARSIAWWGRDCYCVGSNNLLPNGTCGNRFDTWLEDYQGTMDHKYIFTNMGYNLKPLDLQGAIGLVQLGKLDVICERRKNSKKVLSDIFKKNIPNIHIPEELEHANTTWFGTPIVCADKEEKNKLVSFLEDRKIQTRNYFAGNILIHPAYKHLGNFKDYSNANKVLDTVFFIGASPHYDVNIFNYIEEVMKEYK